ncbi:fibronectin type III domain-containing protein [Algoriphagus lacus]|uniref:Fibronectin type III domain-containing protein n=1 Tax=Algoriphagus lacus TaxID=2056311 RepID=A0A418PLD9_9BACT|nr:fibronectin type III domain-containing protein [Algoriphagus lacus]RIW12117.1 fibronectin type III domain-containing protein [Algoriphagus lacus]
MKINFFLLTLLAILVSCEGIPEDGQNPDVPDNNGEKNLSPEKFTVYVDSVSYNIAFIRWDESKDPEGFSTNYTIILGEKILADKYVETSLILDSLKGLTNYKGKVIAKDPQGNSHSVDFDFTTKRDYQTFLKYLNFSIDQECIPGFIQNLFKAPDGNYLAIGKSTENGSNYFNFVAKIDPLGNPIWMKSYPYENGDYWEIQAVLTKTGLLMMSNHHVIKLDTNGNEIWVKAIELFNRGIGGVEIQDIVEDQNEEIFLIGDLNSEKVDVIQQAVLMKLSPEGEILWEKFFDPSLRSTFKRLVITRENDLLILGGKETNGCTREESNTGYCEQNDFWLLKLSLSGEVKWEKTYGDSNFDIPQTLIELENGNFVFGGISVGNSQSYSARILEIRSNGEKLWDHTDPYHHFYSVKETPEHGLVAIGVEDAYSYHRHFGIVKFGADRSVQWRKSYGESMTNVSAKDILVDGDHGFRIAASRENMNFSDCDEKLLFIKTDPLGFFEVPGQN